MLATKVVGWKEGGSEKVLGKVPAKVSMEPNLAFGVLSGEVGCEVKVESSEKKTARCEP
jgi:hypothetical protein